jgi:hypothetical protein
LWQHLGEKEKAILAVKDKELTSRLERWVLAIYAALALNGECPGGV